jgi:hypothetical protein
MEERDETARLLRVRDVAAIALKASFALQIAVARGDVEVEAKYRELENPAVFWAYIAGTRPIYTYAALVEFGRRAGGDRDQWSLFDRE